MIRMTVYVVSKIDIIKNVLTKPLLIGRISKWTLALAEFSLVYLSQRIVKG